MINLNWIFNLARAVVRFTYSLPGGARRCWRVLLVWGRISRVYHRGGMEAVNRKTALKQGKHRSPFLYRG